MSGTAGYLAIWSVVGETPLTSEQYSAMSFDFAERSAIPNDALAIAAMYCAQLAFIARQYEAALDLYERSRSRLERRGLSGDDEWMSVAAELWTRVVPADARADRARSTANLVAWWRGDIVGEA